MKQVEGLIEEKSQLMNKIEVALKAVQKSEAVNKRAQENYIKEMKSRKEAFMSIEREKRHKWEQGRLQNIKEQAIKDTEPKLLQIIKSAN